MRAGMFRKWFRKFLRDPRSIRFAITAILAATAVFGQAGGGVARFEVATIKPLAPGPGENSGRVRTLAGGQTFVASNVALRNLIVTAYSIRPDQVSGGPGWVNSDGYDIEAKASRPSDPEELMRMLRTLLAERFKLTLHDEKRVQPVYALVIEKGMPGLKRNQDLSEPLFFPPELGHYTGRNVTMPSLAWSLGRLPEVGRLVVDKTGLAGGYDFDLRFTPAVNTNGNAAALPAADPGPSLFTALREQLGLKLDSTKEPVDFFTIDHAERPTDN